VEHASGPRKCGRIEEANAHPFAYQQKESAVKLSFVRVLSIASLSLLAVGCQNALHDQNLALRKQNIELQNKLGQQGSDQARIDELTAELQNRPDAQQVDQLKAALAERDQQITMLRSSLNTPTAGQPAGSEPGIEGIETEFNRNTGEMTVRVPGDVLFDAGVATLKPGARGTLDKIADALKTQYAGKAIRVEGHTDSDPLVKTKSQWTDNRGLSSARALAVVRYLESKGVKGDNLVASGLGEHSPRGNDKSKNRRVEIVVVTR
jgi:chemotaxis protein MotB